jgi:hypothetical protein
MMHKRSDCFLLFIYFLFGVATLRLACGLTPEDIGVRLWRLIDGIISCFVPRLANIARKPIYKGLE